MNDESKLKITKTERYVYGKLYNGKEIVSAQKGDIIKIGDAEWIVGDVVQEEESEELWDIIPRGLK